MRPFAQRRVLLGVTGGIACYKSVALARALTQAGAEVDVVQTRSSQDFVGPVTFEAVTGRPVSTHLIAAGHALDHIKLARSAHAIVVAPATADFLARAAVGRADDLLTAILLAADAPVLLVPAMNDRMWSHPQTTLNVAHLRSIGYRVLDPDVGPLAVGEGSGPGRMPEPETIFAHIGRLLDADGVLRGRRIVVTAGSTREPIDPVRFISNRSSGKMGVALAAAAWRRGADVTLIAGPLSVEPPVGVSIIDVETAAEMRDAVAAHLSDVDVLIMAAAPADFRPATVAEQKIKKSSAPASLALEATDDILVSTQELRNPAAIVVGFALETEAAIAGGREKLRRKSLDLVVVNDATEPGAGFGVDTNRVTLVFGNGTPDEALPLLAKSDVADAILDRVEGLLRAR
ncbi:MAG TPA: bifunctional phosphopantothenoylcysteine decarboxylase/phosphopantothenate--cysteine ligase CoaBC [Gemmatimonadaceae bacterium]|nr:bifunctional phosphopantothenoylcysteine decarboxylase/phosphopantothenate--cysteine ligase CoaBC [Gemmatimonadaceae bacterium]